MCLKRVFRVDELEPQYEISILAPRRQDLGEAGGPAWSRAGETWCGVGVGVPVQEEVDDKHRLTVSLREEDACLGSSEHRQLITVRLADSLAPGPQNPPHLQPSRLWGGQHSTLGPGLCIPLPGTQRAVGSGYHSLLRTGCPGRSVPSPGLWHGWRVGTGS